MDFSNEYNDEQKAFAVDVRKWLDNNIPIDLVKPRSIHKISREQWNKRRDLAKRLGEKGWLYPTYPAEYGGGGMSGDLAAVLNIEMVAQGVSLPPHYDSGRLAAPTLLVCATDEQKDRLLPPILTGEKVTWQLFTEPEAGTDEANQQTNALRADREHDSFIINGSKIFVGGLYAPPDQFLLLTRSDLDAPRHQNLAMFLAPADLDGVSIFPLDLFPEGTIGQVCFDAADSAPGVKHSVFFDDVKIPDSYLIGGDNEGWKVTSATLQVEHGDRGGDKVATGAVHFPKNLMVEKLMEQCRTNPKIKKRLEKNPHLMDDVAEAYIGGEVERLIMMRNAALPRMGKQAHYAGPQISLYTKMLGLKMSSIMTSVLGPYALIDDDQVGLEEGLFENCERSSVCVAPAGTPEAMKIIISRALRIGR